MAKNLTEVTSNEDASRVRTASLLSECFIQGTSCSREMETEFSLLLLSTITLCLFQILLFHRKWPVLSVLHSGPSYRKWRRFRNHHSVYLGSWDCGRNRIVSLSHSTHLVMIVFRASDDDINLIENLSSPILAPFSVCDGCMASLTYLLMYATIRTRVSCKSTLYSSCCLLYWGNWKSIPKPRYTQLAILLAACLHPLLQSICV